MKYFKKSVDEFAQLIRKACDPNLQTKAVAGMGEDLAGNGAEMVAPAQITQEVVEGLKYESYVMQKARVYDVSGVAGNTFLQPFFSDTLEDEPTNGTRVYFVDEGGTKTIGTPQVKGADLKLKKMVCRIVITDELLEDNERLVDYVISEATSKLALKIDKTAFIGTNKPLHGVLGSGDRGTVFVASNDPISSANAISYVGSLHPLADEAEWYITKDNESTVLSQDYTNQNALTFEGGKYYLFGRPLNVHAGLEGSPYHVALADLSNYVIYHKGITVRQDPETYFQTNQTQILVELRIAGTMCAETSAADDGGTYGWVVGPTGGEGGASSSSSSSSTSSSSSSSSSSSIDSSSSSSNSSSSSSSSVDSSSSSTSSSSSSSSVDSSSSSSVEYSSSSSSVDSSSSSSSS